MKTMLFVYIALMIFGALRTIIRFVARRRHRKKGEDATMLQQESKISPDFPSSSLVSNLIDMLGRICHMEIQPSEDGLFKVTTTVTTEELIAMLASKIVL